MVTAATVAEVTGDGMAISAAMTGQSEAASVCGRTILNQSPIVFIIVIVVVCSKTKKPHRLSLWEMGVDIVVVVYMAVLLVGV